jgi:hypothetical protein
MRKEIEGHPDYIVSSFGYVIKKSTGKRMATTLTEDAPTNSKCPAEFPAHVWRKLIMQSHHKRLIIAAALLCAEVDRLAYLAEPAKA